MKLKKKKAFTLTELLIVVMVLGVLAAVAVPKFSKVLETQKTTEAEELMAAVRTEQEKRCLLDKPYLDDLAELKDIIPQTESKNYSYSQKKGGVGILASSKGKYNYTLSIPSYRDGRICCEGDECEKLNKDYPLCENLKKEDNYEEAAYECASEVVSPDLNPTPAGCSEEDKPAVSTRNCIEGCGTETNVISCREGKWHEEWVGDCQTQPTTYHTKACSSYDSKYCSGTARTQWKCQGTGEQRAWKEVWNTSNCSRCSSGGSGGGGYWGSTPTQATFITFSGHNGTAYLKSDAILCGGACNAKILKSSNPRTVTQTCATEEEAMAICRSGAVGCVTSFADLPTTCTYSEGADYTCVPRAWTECGDYKGYAFPSEMKVWDQVLSRYDVPGVGLCSQGGTTSTECSGTYKPKYYDYEVYYTNRHGQIKETGTVEAIRVSSTCSDYGEELECTKTSNMRTCNAIYATELNGWTCGSYPSEFTGQACPADMGSGGTGGSRPNCGYASQETT